MSVTFTRDERENVATALTTFADLGDVLARELRSTEPPAGSLIHDWFYSSPVADQAVSAFYAVNTAILTGGDHLRSLNHLTRVATTSAVTVARGAVEAYANASHLATSTSALELADRHLLALESEYKYLVKHSAPLTNLTGATLDPAVALKDVGAVRKRLGRQKATATGMASKVTDVLNRATAKTSGGHVYSGLSSVAHAELTGVGAFVSLDSAGNVSLTFDRDAFVNLVYMSSLAAGQALDDIAHLFGDQPAHRLLLDSAQRIVSDARSALVAP